MVSWPTVRALLRKVGTIVLTVLTAFLQRSEPRRRCSGLAAIQFVHRLTTSIGTGGGRCTVRSDCSASEEMSQRILGVHRTVHICAHHAWRCGSTGSTAVGYESEGLRVRLFRIGDKVVSEDKLRDAVTAILEERESGATQEDAARAHGVQRAFVSFLETLGEVRRGDKVALVGFPIANAAEVKDLAQTHSLDFVLVLSQGERESIESGDATRVFNQLLETIAALQEYDTLVLMASDWRIRTMERILGTEVIGIPLGASPLREDVSVDLDELDGILTAVLSARCGRPGHGRRGAAPDEAADLSGRWKP